MSNMGTVEKIVEVLNNMCHDKKAQATSRYDEHSAWLSSEFSSIRSLIQPVASTTETTTTSNSARQKRKSPETCSAGSRNSPLHKRNSGADIDIVELLVAQNLPADLNKLKKEQLLEQMQSRGCVDMTMKALKKDLVEKLKELVIDMHRRETAAIPVIPNELSSQENIVEEKAVHVEDIEIKEENDVSIEEANLSESSVVMQVESSPAPVPHHHTDQENREEETKEVVVAPVVPAAVLEPMHEDDKMDSSEQQPLEAATTLAPPLRKKSILSEYRQQMTATASSTTTTAPEVCMSKPAPVEESGPSRVQSEFEARRLRHRMSQAGGRPSTSTITSTGEQQCKTKDDSTMQEKEESVVSVTTTTTTTPATVTLTTSSTGVESSKVESSEEELPLQSCMHATSAPAPVSLTVDMDTDHDDEGGDWNEVPSPKRGNSAENEKELKEEDEEEETKVTTVVEAKPHVQKPPTAVVVDVQQQKHQPVPSLKESSVPKPVPTSATSSLSVPVPTLTKKPTNLVGGNQLSFLSGSKTSGTAGASAAPVKTKTVVCDCWIDCSTTLAVESSSFLTSPIMFIFLLMT